MKVLIIENEKPAAQRLIRLLKNSGQDIEIVHWLESVETSTNWLMENPCPDLIFMDIQLDDGLCFEIFENIEVKAPVIFTTAFDEYALRAFKVNSVDYILKPVDQEALNKALDKYRNFHAGGMGSSQREALLDQWKPKIKERFLIKIGEHYKSVPVEDIHCFFIRERCLFICTRNGRQYPVDYSLDKIESMMDPQKYFRISRDCMIRFSSIRDIIAFSSSRLKIILEGWQDPEELIVSRERVSDFKKWMDR